MLLISSIVLVTVRIYFHNEFLLGIRCSVLQECSRQECSRLDSLRAQVQESENGKSQVVIMAK